MVASEAALPTWRLRRSERAAIASTANCYLEPRDMLAMHITIYSVYYFLFFLQGAQNPNSRNALTGDGIVFDGAQIAVLVARQLHFKP
jgi:hypothetical protein